MLDQAIYVSSIDKILGTMGPYVCKFDAATGAREAIQKVAGPARGPCNICLHSGTAYVSVWNSQIGQWYEAVPTPVRDIYPVNVTTLAVGAGIFLTQFESQVLHSTRGAFFAGFGQMVSIGSYLWFILHGGGQTAMGRFDPSNVAAFTEAADYFSPINKLYCDQFSTDATYVYFAHPASPGIARVLVAGATLSVDAYCDMTVPDQGVVMPLSAEYCGASGVWAVCGDDHLVRVNSFGGTDYTDFNLAALGVAGCTPIRLRYRSSNSLLYIPSQGNNSVVIWNPSTASIVETQTGFDGPIDVVFTSSKAFAVQTGLISLKEIT